ncbi:hypothetical protein EVAR_18969_1 [Eumeta japonica]|uniref:Uncharacterized protein n=1 Tax=Eumeta variegata TaxID=151549 RepID=A0A4C1WW67_EUMVA|nr:hypothetical protein EVAR_18969_1 [Eumeta japonica]
MTPGAPAPSAPAAAVTYAFLRHIDVIYHEMCSGRVAWLGAPMSGRRARARRAGLASAAPLTAAMPRRALAACLLALAAVFADNGALADYSLISQ